MENKIIIVFQSIAFISVIFAIILGLGKKYSEEDMKNEKKNSKSK